MVTSSAPRSFDCTAMSMAVMPPPITSDMAADRQLAEVLRLAQLGDIVDRILDAVRCFLHCGVERIDALQTHAEEHRVMVLAQALRA